MLTTISIIIVLACLAVIASIIIKKFPALAILDVENIPGRKEAKFKEEILRKRLERSFSQHGRFFLGIYNFFSHTLTDWLHSAYDNLSHRHKLLHRERRLTLAERRAQVKSLFQSAEDAAKEGEYDKAEQSLIEIIGLEPRNTAAFARLADVYGQGKKWPEARQTWEYAAKLAKQQARQGNLQEDAPALSEIYFSLSQACRNLDQLYGALEHAREALDIEPNNPRFLDHIIEIALEQKDASLAKEMFGRFAEINPENGKLPDWQAKIDALAEGSSQAIE